MDLEQLLGELSPAELVQFATQLGYERRAIRDLPPDVLWELIQDRADDITIKIMQKWAELVRFRSQLRPRIVITAEPEDKKAEPAAPQEVRPLVLTAVPPDVADQWIRFHHFEPLIGMLYNKPIPKGDVKLRDNRSSTARHRTGLANNIYIGQYESGGGNAPGKLEAMINNEELILSQSPGQPFSFYGPGYRLDLYPLLRDLFYRKKFPVALLAVLLPGPLVRYVEKTL